MPKISTRNKKRDGGFREGRKELEDLLRVLEHGERLRVERGEPEYDVSWIRRELNMDKG